MTIAILPARLANQIAAGEVVERPASVIKELIENSLDAGATNINIDVDKGGVKRIRISDNGTGIAKEELTLALSRHATSKIKDLKDLEAIDSLGFRGEALASISSVARLTLTSKPKTQATAWQAIAEGRDMAVTIKPAAHPDGTTIEVLDLFFNTPARRKFLRTEKTEFNHIDEVIRRIALANFNVTFSLTHNGKIIRQYRASTTKEQNAKRVAMICGQNFISNAIEVNCQHDDMLFSGWLAKPSFARSQNDLCYSYVNGRMMRDKLINHAIRQAYADLLPADTYPAFVLFLSLEHGDVDVNVHPAKHEVRFHQSRYVHDFIYSVCHKALMENNQVIDFHKEQQSITVQVEPQHENVQYTRPDYVKPLEQIKEGSYRPNSSTSNYVTSPRIVKSAVDNYQQLMTPIVKAENEHKGIIEPSPVSDGLNNKESFFLAVAQEKYGIFKQQGCLRLLPLSVLEYQVCKNKVTISWCQSDSKENEGLISQPLLLPVIVSLSEQQMIVVQNYQKDLALAGIIISVQEPTKSKNKVQIRQFPALLRDKDISASFTNIVDELSSSEHCKDIDYKSIISAVTKVLMVHNFSEEYANILWSNAKSLFSKQEIDSLLLNSVLVDLTYQIKQLVS